MPLNIKKKAAKLGRAIKNKVSRATDGVRDAVHDLRYQEPYELDDEQMAVADAILASGIEWWEFVNLNRTMMRFLRLKPSAERNLSPFGTLDSFVVELLPPRVMNVGKQADVRQRLLAEVDRYIQIDPYDLILYMREMEPQGEMLYLFELIPAGRAECTADLMFGSSRILDEINIEYSSRDDGWVQSVITSPMSINVMSTRRRNSHGVTIRSTSTADMARARQRQNVVNENAAYRGRPTRRRRSFSGENPLYEG